jgi:hypothetical protein
MAHFVRTHPAPQVKGPPYGYSKFRQHVRQDFGRRCAYCLMDELWAGGEENFELDHFRPKQKFPDLLQDFHNLYWSCRVCNSNKWDHWPSAELEQQRVGLIDFCRHDFQDHFQLSPNGLWVPLTLSAEYTKQIMKLNRPHLVELRVRVGWRPE